MCCCRVGQRFHHIKKEEVEGHTIHRTERSYGGFQRTLAIPYHIDPGQVSAQFEDGVLIITLPKPADAVAQKQSTKIEVKMSTTGASSPGQ